MEMQAANSTDLTLSGRRLRRSSRLQQDALADVHTSSELETCDSELTQSSSFSPRHIAHVDSTKLGSTSMAPETTTGETTFENSHVGCVDLPLGV